MEGGYAPRTVEEVFVDFKARRSALIKALTVDVTEFYQLCDPEKENLCLYGYPNEQWEVNLPADEVPPELPEPALGINFARDGMKEKDWLSLVAVHSDTWLISVAFYFGSRFGFDRADRERLFGHINELPTVYEVVAGIAKKNPKQRSAVSNQSSTKAKSNTRGRGSESQGKYIKMQGKDSDEEGLEEEEEEEEDHGDTLCGACAVGGDMSDANAVKYSSDGRLMLLTTMNGHIHVLDSFRGTLLNTFNVKPVSSTSTLDASFSPEGSYVISGSGDGSVYAWSVRSGKEAASWMSSETEPPVIKWAPGSLMFVTGSSELSFWIPDLSKLATYVGRK